ncbi:MAG: hypothetical protein LBS92_05550 [Candidatus Methanoplasma sp.]|jgi:NADH:ubiquinone oxidoreductase subunit 6 (subunit J)|nr:hypothetical protein [Candidatus Methanoplasma sp.]
MNKRVLGGAVAAAALLAVLIGAVVFTEWDDYKTNDSPEGIPFDNVVDEDGNIDQGSLNYALFEEYGPLLLIVALLMFGAMLGGICIAKEEVENDDSN